MSKIISMEEFENSISKRHSFLDRMHEIGYEMAENAESAIVSAGLSGLNFTCDEDSIADLADLTDMYISGDISYYMPEEGIAGLTFSSDETGVHYSVTVYMVMEVDMLQLESSLIRMTPEKVELFSLSDEKWKDFSDSEAGHDAVAFMNMAGGRQQFYALYAVTHDTDTSGAADFIKAAGRLPSLYDQLALCGADTFAACAYPDGKNPVPCLVSLGTGNVAMMASDGGIDICSYDVYKSNAIEIRGLKKISHVATLEKAVGYMAAVF